MRPEILANQSVNVALVSADKQTARIQGAIARRAFVRCGGGVPGHELEDWRQAESELVNPLCCGLITRDEDIWIGTDVAQFKEGTLEIWVSPRHFTICGESEGGQRAQGEKRVFRELDLSVEVEPAAVTAKVNGSCLEICAPKAHQCLVKATTA